MIGNKAEVLILGALLHRAATQLYGLEITTAISELTNGSSTISAGTLYPTLHRLENKGYVTGMWGDPGENTLGARRRYYQITAEGRNEFRRRQFEYKQMEPMFETVVV